MPVADSDPLVARLRGAGCVWAQEEAVLLRRAAHGTAHLEELVARRCSGEPLEYVVGFAELCGVRVDIAPGVFIPRRRSELIARTSTGLVAPGDVVVDLACGSGALGKVVATMVPGVTLHAADLSHAAVECARGNLGRLGGTVHRGDLYDALPRHLRGEIAVIVANVPYVPTRDLATLPAEARDHEPRMSLDGGEDGLDLARRVVAEASAWLRQGGAVLVETTLPQADSLSGWARDHGLLTELSTDPDLDAHVVVATVVGDG
jgi:release factor glutamine methyltransferase